MSYYLNIDYFLFEPKFWLILGLLLIIIDVFLFSFFLLPIGVAALIMSALIFFDSQHMSESELFTNWYQVLISFSFISVGSIAIIRILARLRRKDREDINDY